MNTRRRFIEILPIASLAPLALMAACSDKAPAPAAPAPAPAPTAAAPTPAPAPAPAPAEAAAPTTPSANANLPMVDPKDTASVALGYVAEASQADVAKYPKFAASQACSNCALFGGKSGDAAGPCPLFAGKQVSAKGWCSAYAKKAA
jgi:hypothetical protein